MEFYIENIVQVEKLMNALQLSNYTDKMYIRQIVKAPIARMESMSRGNLVRQKSYKTGSLAASLRTRSLALPNVYTAQFESDSKYAQALNKGTKDRYTSGGRWTGAVGRATTNYKGRNKLFDIGFADKAIAMEAPGIESYLTIQLEYLVNQIIQREGL